MRQGIHPGRSISTGRQKRACTQVAQANDIRRQHEGGTQPAICRCIRGAATDTWMAGFRPVGALGAVCHLPGPLRKQSMHTPRMVHCGWLDHRPALTVDEDILRVVAVHLAPESHVLALAHIGLRAVAPACMHAPGKGPPVGCACVGSIRRWMTSPMQVCVNSSDCTSSRCWYGLCNTGVCLACYMHVRCNHVLRSAGATPPARPAIPVMHTVRVYVDVSCGTHVCGRHALCGRMAGRVGQRSGWGGGARLKLT